MASHEPAKKGYRASKPRRKSSHGRCPARSPGSASSNSSWSDSRPSIQARHLKQPELLILGSLYVRNRGCKHCFGAHFPVLVIVSITFWPIGEFPLVGCNPSKVPFGWVGFQKPLPDCAVTASLLIERPYPLPLDGVCPSNDRQTCPRFPRRLFQLSMQASRLPTAFSWTTRPGCGQVT